MLRFILSIKNYLHKKFQKKSTCRILKIWCSKFYRKSCTLLIARKYSYPCELRLILSLLAELNDVRENAQFCQILSHQLRLTSQIVLCGGIWEANLKYIKPDIFYQEKFTSFYTKTTSKIYFLFFVMKFQLMNIKIVKMIYWWHLLLIL